MSTAKGVPDVGPDDPPFPENEGPSRKFPCVVPPAGVADVVAVYRNAFPGVPLRVPRNQDILQRDILWCESLICALGEGVIDTRQMERILHIFNDHRPDN
jgi:hypothetical protein